MHICICESYYNITLTYAVIQSNSIHIFMYFYYPLVITHTLSVDNLSAGIQALLTPQVR